MSLKMVNCEQCPCLNTDIERGSSCNLGFATKMRKTKSGNFVTSSRVDACALVMVMTVNLRYNKPYDEDIIQGDEET
jgi:hypothetical protein